MKNIIAISLAFLMLTSQLGIAMNTHFCGDIAVKTAFSIGEEHLDCGMANMDTDCDLNDNQHTSLSAQSCCKNIHQLLTADDNFKHQLNETQLSPTFFVTFVHTFIMGLEEVQKEKYNFNIDSPPLVFSDFQVLYQTFLI